LRPARQVQPSGFGSSAQPTISNRPVAKVQTGGFGDTNGVPANTNSHGPANIAAVGSFDLPSGPGLGNGSGGARGLRGVIPSAGFGNGIAQQGHPGTQIHIQSTDFGSIGDGTGTGIGKRPGGPVARPKVAPVEILSKPAPTYTEEARELHIEGEVLIQVVFTSTAEVRVVRVLKGLGHGLDEAAVQAAQKIRFTPAKQDSEYVDSPATLHIVFQLS
jgi:TonB family protein